MAAIAGRDGRFVNESIHRVLPNTTHASLIEDRGDAAMASQAIRDVVDSVRAATRLTKP